MRPPARALLAAGFAALACAAPLPAARAGVTLETRMDVAMLASTGHGTGRVEIEGRSRREVRTLALAVPGMDAPPEQRSDAITRLDRGVQWQLDSDDSSYRAVPLPELGRQMATAGPGGMGVPGLLPGAVSSVTWDVVVTPRGESAVIAGCRARRTDIVLTGTSHDPDAGAASTLRLVSEWWMATRAPGAGEVQAFEHGFEAATGGLGSDVPGLLAGLPGAADAVARLTAARRGLAGLPMRTMLRLEAPGLASMLGQALGGGGGSGGEGHGGEARGGANDGAGEDAPPLLTSTIEVTSIHVGRVAASRFALPKGFHEAAPDTAEATPPEVHE